MEKFESSFFEKACVLVLIALREVSFKPLPRILPNHRPPETETTRLTYIRPISLGQSPHESYPDERLESVQQAYRGADQVCSQQHLPLHDHCLNGVAAAV